MCGAEIDEQAGLPFAAGNRWNCLSAEQLETTVENFDFDAAFDSWCAEKGMVDIRTLKGQELIDAYRVFYEYIMPGATFLAPQLPRVVPAEDGPLRVIFGSYPSAEGGAASLLAPAAEGSNAVLAKPVWNMANAIFREDFGQIMVINLCNIALTYRLCKRRGIVWLLGRWPKEARLTNALFLRQLLKSTAQDRLILCGSFSSHLRQHFKQNPTIEAVLTACATWKIQGPHWSVWTQNGHARTVENACPEHWLTGTGELIRYLLHCYP
jgi:hypothetical protein